jgi:hypothetical protein
MSLKSWALGAIAAIGIATAASAMTLDGSIGFQGVGALGATSGGSVVVTLIIAHPLSQFGGEVFGSSPTGDFDGASATPFISFAPLVFADDLPTTISFETALGSFFGELLPDLNAPLAFFGGGTFTPAAPGALSAFASSPLGVSLFIFALEACIDDTVCLGIVGALVSGAFPTGVPAPAGLALFGLGLLGLAALRRR